MIDLDDLIAALRERAASDSPAHTLMNEAADALVSVRAERDAALARIAKLEEELEIGKHLALGNMQLERDRALNAEARIAEAAKLHRPVPHPIYAEHRAPNVCAHCRRTGRDMWQWPCPTAVALGLNELERKDSGT